ncbi:MAG: hypothetical protein M1828_002224 [Chrysothrix sp. TS-e1954]|nr:MAG: hypothetical protein M1828_002224 [Chrysothrix sp. TS-e1954]
MTSLFRFASVRTIGAGARPSIRSAAPLLNRTAATTPQPDPHNPKASPSSDSPQESSVKASRATDRSPDDVRQSTTKPMSGKGDVAATSEEGTDPAKKGGPNTPDHEKRAAIEREGQKPLDPADK